MRSTPVRLSLLLISFSLVGCQTKPEGGAHVQARLSAALPVGSTFAQVTHYLTDQKIQYRVTAEGRLVKALMNDAAQEAASPGKPPETSYALRFQFDAQDHLNALSVIELNLSSPKQRDDDPLNIPGGSSPSRGGQSAGPVDESVQP